MKPSAKIVSFKVDLHHQKALVPRTRDAPFYFPAYRQAGLINFKIFQFLPSSFHSRIGIILIFILFACKTKDKCSEEELNAKQEQFELAFEDWTAALNYMDGDVIFPVQSTLDSSYLNLSNCIELKDSFMVFIDSISHIYADLNIEKFEIEKGEEMVEKLIREILN